MAGEECHAVGRVDIEADARGGGGGGGE